MGVKADLSSLRVLELYLDAAVQQGLPLVKKAVEEQARAIVRESFRLSIAPDGSRWAPLRRRAGQPLVDTGRLRASIQSYPAGARQVVVGTQVVYAKYHQHGTRWIPARPFLPGAGALPPRWQTSLERAARDALDALR